MQKVLLHACCAVCASYCIEYLPELGYSPVVYFYNPNIFPQAEYKIRLEELVSYCSDKNIPYVISDYSVSDFYNCISGFESCPEKGERCNKCFELRLNNTAKYAFENGFEYFTTTLTISPHKISKNVFNAGKNAANAFGVKFLEIDFKKKDGFKKAQKIAKELNMYKQNYCGCEFSIRKENLLPL